MSVIYGSFLQRRPGRTRRACNAKTVSSDYDTEPFRHQLNVQLIAYAA